jgi:hypothetical protein
MNIYTVIWRDNGDDFMFTQVSTASNPVDLSNLDWVLMAGEVEYAEWDVADRVAAMADLLDGYDLLDVLVGVPESALV